MDSKTSSSTKKTCFYSFKISKNILIFSGAKRDRTVNLRLARAALSQLSYSPSTFFTYTG